jgi:hypothetical protein
MKYKGIRKGLIVLMLLYWQYICHKNNADIHLQDSAGNDTQVNIKVVSLALN